MIVLNQHFYVTLFHCPQHGAALNLSVSRLNKMYSASKHSTTGWDFNVLGSLEELVKLKCVVDERGHPSAG